MCHLMYEKDENWQVVLRGKQPKLCPSRPELFPLPSVFHTKKDYVLKDEEVDATIADHSVTKGPTHFRRTQDHRLIRLGGVVLLRCEVFLVTWSNIERLSCLMGSEQAGDTRSGEP